MSGGSYNYLFSKTLKSDDSPTIERMARRLSELGHEDAAARTLEVAAALRRAVALQEELLNVWHAVEWIDSHDMAEGDEQTALRVWRQEHPAPPQSAMDVVGRLHRLEQELEALREMVLRGLR